MATYSDTTYYNPPSPVGGYVRALLFTLILAIVGIVAVTVFQNAPATRAATLAGTDNAVYADTAGEPAAVDAQPITN